MSTFAARMIPGLAAIYARLGDTATFRNANGQKCDCTVILDRNLANYGDVAAVAGLSAVLTVRKSEIEQVPLRGETFAVIDPDLDTCETFTVDSALDSDEHEHRLFVA